MPNPAPKPVPDGMHTVTMHLWFNGNCADAVAFYQTAFGAELAAPVVPGPEGKGVMHAMLRIGDSQIMMADSWPGQYERGPAEAATASPFLYVEDVDAAFDQAVKEGCDTMEAPTDMFWGDRMAKVKDPFGHVWALATHKWIYSAEEIAAGQDAWLSELG